MKNSIIFLLCFALFQLSGCSIATYPTADISENPSLVHFDINNPPFDADIEYLIRNGAVDIKGMKVLPKFEFGANTTFSVKYHRSKMFTAPNATIPVEFPNGLKYGAYLDTGFSEYILLTSDVVLDNKFSILPITNSVAQGLCHIPLFKIGTARIKDTAGFYWGQQLQYRIMNVPVNKYSAIILGLAFIKTFDYVLFDNVNQEVVFSKEGAFVPDNPDLWQSYPFEIKPDSVPNDRIMVQIPIDGQMFELWFDSCGSLPGLRLSKSDWQVIEPNSNVKRLRKSHFYNAQSRRLQCQMATVSELSIGEKTINNANVSIYDDQDGLSMLSLGYFQDTSVVLDFVNKLFWFKKHN